MGFSTSPRLAPVKLVLGPRECVLAWVAKSSCHINTPFSSLTARLRCLCAPLLPLGDTTATRSHHTFTHHMLRAQHNNSRPCIDSGSPFFALNPTNLGCARLFYLCYTVGGGGT